MISNNQIKFLRSLHLKKNRDAQGMFLIEGDKIVEEAINEKIAIENIYASSSWLDENQSLLGGGLSNSCVEVDQKTLQKIGQLSTVNRVVAVVKRSKSSSMETLNNDQWIIALDRVQDPGNLGTIIRTADWFGIKNIICSKGCVEVYNPKVIQSTMGSVFRVNVQTEDLVELVNSSLEKTIPIYGAALTGKSLVEMKNVKPGILLFGNESKGLSSELLELVSHQLLIPGSGQAESLNVAIAAGIIMAWATSLN